MKPSNRRNLALVLHQKEFKFQQRGRIQDILIEGGEGGVLLHNFRRGPQGVTFNIKISKFSPKERARPPPPKESATG